MAALSQWLQLMLEEISRKREDLERARDEQAKRRDEKSQEAPHCGEPTEAPRRVAN